MRYKTLILLLILSCSGCLSYGELRVSERVYAPIHRQQNWRHSYKVKYLAPAYCSRHATVIAKANSLMKQGLYTEAVAILSQLPVNGNDADRIYNNLGVGYEILGERDKSLASYSAACRLSPNNPYYRSNINSL